MEQSKYLSTKFGYVIFITLVSSRFWSFHGVPERIFDVLEFLSAFSLIAVVFAGVHLENKHLLFKNNVLLFIFIPLVSAVAATVFHDQPLVYGLAVLRTNFAWLLYFALHIFNVPKKLVIGLMTFVGIVWALLTIGQQYTYPFYIFYTRTEEIGPEFIRAGLYRFMLEPQQYGLFLIVYYYNRFLLNKKLIYLIPLFIGIAGFYYYATRQFAFAALICIVIASISQPGVAKFYFTGAIVLVLCVLLIYQDAIFGPYIQMTNEQLNSMDDIRLHSAKYFLFDYWPHWTTVLTGNGLEHMNTSYGQELFYLSDAFYFYKSDVGIIGALNTFGIFYVINIVWLNIKGLNGVYYDPKTQYLRLIFINAILLLVISEYYSTPSVIPFFCFVLYLVDKSYQKNLDKSS